MPSISPGITKNPPCGHLVFILFMYFLKKASALRRQNAPTVPHIYQFACSMVRPFHSFHSLRLLRSFSVHSCVPAAHASVTATLAWHFVPCSLRSHSFTHSFISLFRSFMPACRLRASHRYTRLTLRAMLASLAFIHFIAQLIRFAASFAYSFHSFHVRPLSHASRICQGSLLTISTIRVASQWDK